MPNDTAKRDIALLALARRALDGAGADALVEAAVEALASTDGPEAARSIGERIARARGGHEVPDDREAAGDPIVEEVLSLVRSATEHCAASWASAERYRLMLERAWDGIYIVDASGRYVDANASGAA